jgi:hypothetical protein
MIGLVHSNENGVAYGDSTDYMAAGHPAYDWPRKCFNGYKNWQLGWYKDRQIMLESLFDEGHIVKLASFVDFSRTDLDEPVVIVIANELYLVFNLARDFNIDTEEKRNQVTITIPGESGSEAAAGLKEKESYRVQNFQKTRKELVVEVCTRDRGNFGAYVMWVSIAFDKSLCDEAIEDIAVKGYRLSVDMSDSPSAAPSHKKRTHSPTLSPSLWPSDSPSKIPTLDPSRNPTPHPSSTSKVPSYRPTKNPTITPTFDPTTPSTISPTLEYDSVVLPPMTALPTQIDYQKLLKKRENKIKDSVTVKLEDLENLFQGKR